MPFLSIPSSPQMEDRHQTGKKSAKSFAAQALLPRSRPYVPIHSIGNSTLKPQSRLLRVTSTVAVVDHAKVACLVSPGSRRGIIRFAIRVTTLKTAAKGMIPGGG